MSQDGQTPHMERDGRSSSSSSSSSSSLPPELVSSSPRTHYSNARPYFRQQSRQESMFPTQYSSLNAGTALAGSAMMRPAASAALLHKKQSSNPEDPHQTGAQNNQYMGTETYFKDRLPNPTTSLTATNDPTNTLGYNPREDEAKLRDDNSSSISSQMDSTALNSYEKIKYTYYNYSRYRNDLLNSNVSDAENYRGSGEPVKIEKALKSLTKQNWDSVNFSQETFSFSKPKFVSNTKLDEQTSRNGSNEKVSNPTFIDLSRDGNNSIGSGQDHAGFSKFLDNNINTPMVEVPGFNQDKNETNVQLNNDSQDGYFSSPSLNATNPATLTPATTPSHLKDMDTKKQMHTASLDTLPSKIPYKGSASGINPQRPMIPIRPQNLVPSYVESKEVIPDRRIWQVMLNSVLDGDVLKAETRRYDISTIDVHDQSYRIWVEIRAYINGKSVPEELQRIKERKLDADSIFQQLLNFKVEKGKEYDSVKQMLDQVESIQALYPNLKNLEQDLPIYGTDEVQNRLSALYSWILLNHIVKSQLSIISQGELQYTGQNNETNSNESHPDNVLMLPYARSALEHVDVQKSYREGALALILKLVKKTKTIIEESHSTWLRVGLYADENDIARLVSFVPSFIRGVMELRIETSEKIHFTGAGLDAFIDDFLSLLELGVQAKVEFSEIGTGSDVWTFGTGITAEYERVLYKSLKCYFELIIRRLKTGSELAFCKEIDTLQGVWEFFLKVTPHIEKGDIGCANNIIALLFEIMTKMHTFVEQSVMAFDEDASIADVDKSIKSVSRMLEVLKERIRDVIKHYTAISHKFNNAIDFAFEPEYLQVFAREGYISLRCDHFPSLYILASPNTSVDNAIACLTTAFGSNIKGHIVIVPANDSQAQWKGRNINIRLDNPPKIVLKPKRMRAVLMDIGHINSIIDLYSKGFGLSPISSNRANLDLVQNGLKALRVSIFRLADGLMNNTVAFDNSCLKTLGRAQRACPKGLSLFKKKTNAKEKAIEDAQKSPTDPEDENAKLNSITESFILVVQELFNFSGKIGLEVVDIKKFGKKYASTVQKLVTVSQNWTTFIVTVRETVPHEKLLIWAVEALQFVRVSTQNKRINTLDQEEFKKLKSSVSECMLLLLQSFDSGKHVDVVSEGKRLGSIEGVNGSKSSLSSTGGNLNDKPKNDSTASSDNSAVVIPNLRDLAPNRSRENDSNVGSDRSNSSRASNAYILPLENTSLLDLEGDTDMTNHLPVDIKDDRLVTSAMSRSGSLQNETEPETQGNISPSVALADMSETKTDNKLPVDSKKQINLESGVSLRKSKQPSVGGSKSSSTKVKDKLATSNKHDLAPRQRKWMDKIEELERSRHDHQQEVRQIGKVLDSTKIADRNISILARASSSISLRWQQGKFLGGGSFGNVYLGINLETEDVMAVKEIRFSDVTNLDKLQQSITDEMDVLRLLHHKNIIEYYGVEVYRDRIYIFMEYCPFSLSGLLERGRITNENLTQVLTHQMLMGLKYLHEKGVVHRDVKPANVLIGQDFNIKIVDFGASKMYKTQKTIMVNGTANTLVGTPQYIAPEIITNEGLGKAGLQDIWSLGCCILEMVTGRKPWAPLDNEWAIMYHIGKDDQIPELPTPEEASSECTDFLTKCFVRKANLRPSATVLLSHPWVDGITDTKVNLREEISAIMDKTTIKKTAPLPAVNGDRT